jgi:hypothetical protein
MASAISKKRKVVGAQRGGDGDGRVEGAGGSAAALAAAARWGAYQQAFCRPLRSPIAAWGGLPAPAAPLAARGALQRP